MRTNSVRFNIEQGIENSGYIHYLTNYFHRKGYCSYIVPKLVGKKTKDKNWFNYRLTLYTYSSLLWIHDSFYQEVNGKLKKVVPCASDGLKNILLR